MTATPDTRLDSRFLTSLLLTLAAASAGPVSAQERWAVIVPDFANAAGEKGNFGKDVAKEFKKLLADYPTHRPADEEQLKRVLDQFEIEYAALSDPECVTARQLRSHTNARLVLCGVWHEAGRDDFVVSAQVMAVGADPFTISELHAINPQNAAEQLLTAFDRFVVGLRVASYCHENVNAENWADAVSTCRSALEANPRSANAAYNLASALWQTGDVDEAAAMFRQVLEIDPANFDAMLGLGILAAEQSDTETAIRYFREYLTFNPGNARVRLNIATDAAQAGDYDAALQIIEEGLSETTGEELIDLEEFAGAIAMNAAIKRMNASGDPTTLGDARPIVERGMRYLEQVHDARGFDMDVTGLRNMLTAYRLLEQHDRAVEFGQQAVRTHPDDPTIWSGLADALSRVGRVQEALDALEQAASAEPGFAIHARKAAWLAATDDFRAAFDAIRVGSERGEITPQNAELLAQKVAVAGFRKAQAGQHTAALPYYDDAADIVFSPAAKGMIAFFRGYSIYSLAVEKEEPQTLQTAEATLPQFRRTIQLMQEAAVYTATNPNLEKSRTEIIEKAGQYIEIQQAIIKRGR